MQQVARLSIVHRQGEILEAVQPEAREHAVVGVLLAAEVKTVVEGGIRGGILLRAIPRLLAAACKSEDVGLRGHLLPFPGQRCLTGEVVAEQQAVSPSCRHVGIIGGAFAIRRLYDERSLADAGHRQQHAVVAVLAVEAAECRTVSFRHADNGCFGTLR